MSEGFPVLALDPADSRIEVLIPIRECAVAVLNLLWGIAESV